MQETTLDKVHELASTPARRVGLCAALSVPVLAVYTLVNGAIEPRYDLLIGLDHQIPFIPWTFPLYMSLYAFLLAAASLVEPREFVRGLVALLLTSVISFGVFFLLPAAYPQPDVSTIAPPWDAAFRWLHRIDAPQNTFPSLHVGCTASIAWMLRGHRLRVVWFTWAVLISLTTLTTKQHFVVDVIGGLVVALIVNAAVRRWSGG